MAGLTTGLLTARWLGPEGKGLLAIFLLVSTVGSQVATMGLHDAASFLRRRRSFSLARLTRVFDLYSLSLGVLASAGIASGMYSFGTRFWTYPIPPLLAGLTGVLVFFKLSVLLSKGLLLAEQRFGSVAALDLTDGALPGLGFIAASLFASPSASVAAFSFTIASAMIAVAARARLATVPRAAEHGSATPATEVFRYGLRTYLRQIGQIAMSRGDVFIVAHLLGVGAVGLYSVGTTLSELIVRIPDSVGWMLMPNAASVSDERARSMTAQYARLALLATSALAIPYAIGVAIVIPALLPRFETSALILACLLPGVAVSSVTRILSADLVGRGKAGIVAKITWAIFAVVITMDLMLIPRLGLLSAAVVATVGQLIGAGVTAKAYANESGVKMWDLFLVRNTDLVKLPILSAMSPRRVAGRAQG